ncbi:hypothetical protein F2Q70_00028910 [Brassica cretica]|uniref:Uncharacterized protein n=1 Tax=Brassica cretica TaxID=69181 RepID=A0A8S9L7Z5_BRACR|nr:hypothetical protein F2Q68_00028474 [Brassica cretica]KAF2602322.1 hypothetical protein F2Q70_00028910 [Brassica cretica]
MRKADKRRILGPYLQHIHRVTDELEQRNTELKLFMNVNDDMKRKKNVRWRSIPFNYPCTFDNIAMETDDGQTRRKSVIVIEDLDRFISSKPTAVSVSGILKRTNRPGFAPTGPGRRSHPLPVEGMFQNGASLSPAEIGELMIANRSSPTRALKHVINAMQTDGDHRRGAGRRLILESGSRRSTKAN